MKDGTRTKVLVRSRQGRMVTGACAGAAEYFSIDVTLVRALMAVITVITGGAGVLAYLAAWAVVPGGRREDRFSRPGTDGPQDTATTTAGSACMTPSTPLRCSAPPRTLGRTARQHELARPRRPARTAAARIGSSPAQPGTTCDAGQETTRLPGHGDRSQDPARPTPATGRGSSHLDTAVTDSEHSRPPRVSDTAPNAEYLRLKAVRSRSSRQVVTGRAVPAVTPGTGPRRAGLLPQGGAVAHDDPRSFTEQPAVALNLGSRRSSGRDPNLCGQVPGSVPG